MDSPCRTFCTLDLLTVSLNPGALSWARREAQQEEQEDEEEEEEEEEEEDREGQQEENCDWSAKITIYE